MSVLAHADAVTLSNNDIMVMLHDRGITNMYDMQSQRAKRNDNVAYVMVIPYICIHSSDDRDIKAVLHGGDITMMLHGHGVTN
eukprot:1992056-Lingulodinium_polyedra.AAC.1